MTITYEQLAFIYSALKEQAKDISAEEFLIAVLDFMIKGEQGKETNNE
jgi:hypothetical protein